MKPFFCLFLFSINCHAILSQNVGIGTNDPKDRLDVAGKVRTNGVRISGSNSVDLGFGIASKEVNAGRIGYGLFTPNTMDIIGAGTGSDNRRIRLWAEGATEFTGPGHFFGNVGIGTAPVSGLSLTLSSSSNLQLSMRNPTALATDVKAGLAFGGSNYTTGLIQTIGTGYNQARMGFFTGYSFTGGATLLAERLTINNEGRVGINRTAPVAQLEIGSTGSLNWLLIISDNTEVFNLSSNGLKFDKTKSSYKGATLVNTNNSGLAKWGYAVQGAEMLKNSEQSVAHGVATRINFNSVVFDHNNQLAFDDATLAVASFATDEFKMMHDGIVIVEIELFWAGSPAGLGGGGLRNGAVLVKRNGTTARRLEYSSNNFRDHCFITCDEGDIITLDVYHEHCVDPPPICITGMARTLLGARATVINL